MSFQVQTETLRQHAKLWVDHATDVSEARASITPAVGRGDDFGYLAGLNGVADHYDTWTQAMDQALADAETCFRYLEAALTATADRYDDSDATVAADMATLDRMI
jgi:hypothetical protein